MSIAKQLLPILGRAESGSVIKIVSYRFEYEPAWNPGSKPAWNSKSNFYNLIKKLSEDEEISVMLLGGMPSSDEYRDSLQELYNVGADIRILEEPPTAHPFVYNSPSGKDFVWFEAEHRDDRARCISWTSKPGAKDMKYANNYFDELWDTGTPFDEVPHAK